MITCRGEWGSHIAAMGEVEVEEEVLLLVEAMEEAAFGSESSALAPRGRRLR